jgi:hypothetical protein
MKNVRKIAMVKHEDEEELYAVDYHGLAKHGLDPYDPWGWDLGYQAALMGVTLDEMKVLQLLTKHALIADIRAEAAKGPAPGELPFPQMSDDELEDTLKTLAGHQILHGLIGDPEVLAELWGESAEAVVSDQARFREEFGQEFGRLANIGAV